MEISHPNEEEIGNRMRSFTELQDHLGGKIPLRALSPTIIPALPGPPLRKEDIPRNTKSSSFRSISALQQSSGSHSLWDCFFKQISGNLQWGTALGKPKLSMNRSAGETPGRMRWSRRALEPSVAAVGRGWGVAVNKFILYSY